MVLAGISLIGGRRLEPAGTDRYEKSVSANRAAGGFGTQGAMVRRSRESRGGMLPCHRLCSSWVVPCSSVFYRARAQITRRIEKTPSTVPIAALVVRGKG